MKQLELNTIVRHSFKVREKRIRKYVRENKAKYIDFALRITPKLTDPAQIWDRMAFAILSANCNFEMAVKALAYATECKGNAVAKDIARFSMVPRKAEYLNKLPRGIAILQYLKRDSESWCDYRWRLKSRILGLGLAKATFAACLLYPLKADLGCVDTHMCKFYLNLTTFQTLSLKKYRSIETKIRAIAKRARINTFLAQWLIWDHTRGIVSDHNIFPGSHAHLEERKAA